MKSPRANYEHSSQGRIGRGVEVSGDVMFTGLLEVDGKVTGKLLSESGTLVIEQTDEVNADAEVGVCVIRGALRGNLRTRSRLEVSRTGRIQGDIKTPVLIVEEGAQLTGTISMGEASEPLREQTRTEESEPLKKS